MLTKGKGNDPRSNTRRTVETPSRCSNHDIGRRAYELFQERVAQDVAEWLRAELELVSKRREPARL